MCKLLLQGHLLSSAGDALKQLKFVGLFSFYQGTSVDLCRFFIQDHVVVMVVRATIEQEIPASIVVVVSSLGPKVISATH
jgi:hypothetical protein